MPRLPDDIEQYLIIRQYGRAIEALARRRCITLCQAREVIKDRLIEIAVEAAADAPVG